MAIELPGPVVDFLNFIGVGFPYVNEDSVRAFATHVRDFAANIEDTHSAASSTVQQMSAAYQGASYEALVTRWAEMSNTHVHDLVEACDDVATGLDAAAEFIAAKKLEAIGQFAIMAAEFVADQAASIATLGLAEGAEVAIVAAGRELARFLERELEQYIIGEVLQVAIPPLMEVVRKAVGGMVYNAVSDVLGGGSGGAAVGSAFSMDYELLDQHAEMFEQHATAIEGHAQSLVSNLQSLNFGG